MRYRSIAIVQPNSRTNNSGYLIHHRNHRNKHSNEEKVQSKTTPMKGSGVIDDADMLYMKSKEGNGLKLAGQGHCGSGLSPAGGAMMLDGSGLDLPGGSLRASLMKSMQKKTKKRVVQSTDKDLGSAYSVGTTNSLGMGKHGKMKGMGRTMRGMGPNDVITIQNLLSGKVIPALLEKMNLHKIVPQELINKVVEKSTSVPTNTIKDVVADLSKAVLPIITQSKLAQDGVKSGGAYKRIMKSKKYKKLHGHLGKYLVAEMTVQDGSGFFGDLWSGIKSVFRSVIQPIVKIAAPVASFFMPEFAPEIGLVSGLIGKV